MQTEITTAEPLTPLTEAGPYRVEQYFDLSDDERYELIYGRLYVAPSPNIRHQTVTLLLGEIFLGLVRKTGARVYVAPTDVVLSDNSVVQPDVVYISRERRSIIQQHIAGTPDLVVEVLSPGTARRDRSEKLRLYAESGVRDYWIVDPMSEHIEFLINEGGVFKVTLAENDRYASTVFSEVQIDLAVFWQEVTLFQE